MPVSMKNLKFKLRLFLLPICFITSCGSNYIIGPIPPKNYNIEKAIVEQLEDKKNIKVITNKDDLLSVSFLLSEEGWENSNRSLVPRYKLTVYESNKREAIYWIGLWSYPPTFPCYSLCSGYWLAASDEGNKIDTSKYKNLASSSHMYRLVGLLPD